MLKTILSLLPQTVTNREVSKVERQQKLKTAKDSSNIIRSDGPCGQKPDDNRIVYWPVLACLSLPAKSTRFSLAALMCSSPSSPVSQHSRCIVKMEWLRDESAFISVAPVERFFQPRSITHSQSITFLHGCIDSPTTAHRPTHTDNNQRRWSASNIGATKRRNAKKDLRILNGHGNLNWHLCIMGIRQDSGCPLC